MSADAAAHRAGNRQRHSDRQGAGIERGGADRGRGDRDRSAGAGLGAVREFWTKRRASRGIPITSRRASWVRLWRARSIRAAWRAPCGWRCIPNYGVAVVVPDFVLPTAEARRVLPERYSREDTIFNVQRRALLIAALATGAPARFPPRSKIGCISRIVSRWFRGWRRSRSCARPGCWDARLSGAGPSILVFYERGHEDGLRAGARRVRCARAYLGDCLGGDREDGLRVVVVRRVPALTGRGYSPWRTRQRKHEPTQQRKKSLPAAARENPWTGIRGARRRSRKRRARTSRSFFPSAIPPATGAT